MPHPLAHAFDGAVDNFKRTVEVGCGLVGFCLFAGLFYPAVQSNGLEAAVLVSLLVTSCLCCCCCGGAAMVRLGRRIGSMAAVGTALSISAVLGLLCSWPLARGGHAWWEVLLMFLGIFVVAGLVLSVLLEGVVLIMGREGPRSRRRRFQSFTDHKDSEMRQLLLDGTIRFLSCKWLLEADKVLRCQDLPREALLDPQDALRCFMGNRVFVLSYGWLKPSNPDPYGARLRAVQQYLKEYCGNPGEWAFFWDFGSLPQGDDRTPEQRDTFDRALRSISTLYASMKTTVLALKEIPERPADEPDYKDTAYDKRAWCVFEYTVAGFSAYYADSKDLLQEIASGPSRSIPSLKRPDVLAAERAVEEASFTCGKDHRDKVMQQLREFNHILRLASAAAKGRKYPLEP